MIEIIARYYLYFMIYSFIGWLMEVIVTLYNSKKFVNRGFLIGPYCPIYGWGCLFIIIFIGKNTNDVLSVFLKTMLICSLLEYFTSYFMEKIFKLRWWDYSKNKFNINGRICLETMIPFGLLGCFVIYILHPIIELVVNKLNPVALIITAITIFIIYLVDKIVSFNITLKVKGKINTNKKDSTEELTKQVKEWIHNNSILYRRLHSAFPNFSVKLKKYNK